MGESHVLYSVSDGIARIELNRPQKLNALALETFVQLRELIVRFDEDPEAHLCILSGKGRAFCSGADLSQRTEKTSDAEKTLLPDSRIRAGDLLLHLRYWKPVIAAVHGYAVGAGLHLALSCDLIVAASGCKFQVSEVLRGMNGVGLWGILRERVGAGFANDVCMTGRFWDSDEAMAHGILTAVSTPDGAGDSANALAETILSLPPVGVREVVRRRRLALEEIELANRAAFPRHIGF